MKYRPTILWTLTIAVTVSLLFAFQNAPTYNKKEGVLMQAILAHLEQRHFQPQTIDDHYSEQVFDLYLERLDPYKRLLLTDEVASLRTDRTNIDDQMLAASYPFFDRSVDLITAADERAYAIYQEIIAQPFDLDMDEYHETDRDNLTFCSEEGELRNRWRQMLKYSVLNDVMSRLETQEADDFEGAVLSMDSIVIKSTATVKRRMDRWWNRRNKTRRVDWLSTYLNSITKINDPHTGYFKPKDRQDFDLRMSNRLEGIGARLTQDGDFVKVVDVVPGGPAYKEGSLKVDDLIVKVGQEEEDAVEVTGWHIDDVIGLIRGKKGSNVRLYVKRVDGSINEVRITRDIIVFDEGYAKSYIIEHDTYQDKIGYIMLPSFYFDSGKLGARSSATDVKNEVAKMVEQDVDGIIIDLRDNGGGSLQDVVRMSGLFIESGPIVQVKSRDTEPTLLKDRNSSVQYDGPLAVMVNQGSASASEILAAALQDYERAIIIGNRTFGKGTVQRFFNLDRAIKNNEDVKPLGEVKLTTQKFFRVNGGATQLEGVTPDILLPHPYQHFPRGERDYDHAMEWSSIEPAEYEQKAYVLSNKDVLIEQSNQRVEANETFQQVNAYADLLKKNKDETTYSLDFEEFKEADDARDEAFAAYKDIYQPIEALNIENIAADLEEINADSTKIARNERMLKELKKDVELEETMAVLHDMILMDKQAMREESDQMKE